MNYIAHLTGFFRRIARDHRFNPTHVSLYMALFQQWNQARFRNPLSVARDEVMGISRISSRVTYHKCIRDLHAWGYIHYDPSYNHFRGSLVYMLGLEGQQRAPLSHDNSCTGAKPELYGTCPGADRELDPSINSTNGEKDLNPSNGRERAPAPSLEEEATGRERKEKGAAEKEKKGAPPPGLAEVRAFFEGQGFRELEAFRFYHHYSANGWKMGSQPVCDWRAAAWKWVHNAFAPAAHTPPEQSTPTRDYGEAL